ncbi:hypothetical protein VPH35_123241 [Triticum aestivum]
MSSTPPPSSQIVSSSFCVGRDVPCPQRNLGIVCVSVLVGVVHDLRWRCVCVCAVFCCYLDTLCLVGALFIKRGESLFRYTYYRGNARVVLPLGRLGRLET